MADWVTISALATAGGTLVLAVATFSAVRSANRLTRDIYVPAGDTGFWQGAFRDPNEPLYAVARDAATTAKPVTIDLLYGDHEGGQRMISRFGLSPTPGGTWLAVVARHWNLDRPNPR
jgi:hypothetical protein